MACSYCKESGHNKRTCKGRKESRESSEKDTAEIPQKQKDLEKLTRLPKVVLKTHDPDSGEITSKSLNDDKKERNYGDFLLVNVSSDNGLKSEQTEEHVQESGDNNNTETTATADWKISINRPKKGNTYIRDTEAVLIRILKGPTKNDGPGFIYMYKLSLTKTEDEDKLSIHKIGLSESFLVEKRIGIQCAANKERYDKVFSIGVAWRYVTDTVIKEQLSNRRFRREVKDGKTEWYKGDLGAETGIDMKEKVKKIERKFIEVIMDAKKVVESIWGGNPPKEGL